MGALVLLGQAVGSDPGFEEGLELVEGGLGCGAELLDLLGEEGGEGGEVRHHHSDSFYTVILTAGLDCSS